MLAFPSLTGPPRTHPRDVHGLLAEGWPGCSGWGGFVCFLRLPLFLAAAAAADAGGGGGGWA